MIRIHEVPKIKESQYVYSVNLLDNHRHESLDEILRLLQNYTNKILIIGTPYMEAKILLNGISKQGYEILDEPFLQEKN